MKNLIRTFVLLLAFGISIKAMTQGTTLTVFSEKGENFTVLVNDEKKNSKPGDHVQVEGLYGPSFKVRIVFQDVAIKEIEKTIFNSPSSELYYVVKPAKKGYVLEKTSSDYSHPKEAVKESSSSSSTQKENKQTSTKSETAGKKSRGGCDNPMSEPDFQASTVAVSSAPFDPIKLTQAKKVAESHCLYARQIVELMYILNGESNRLALAKTAYKHCYDPENYSDVKDALHSTRSKEDLESYIQSVK
jgi:hypothetical protein